jgi:hypothetical protein
MNTVKRAQNGNVNLIWQLIKKGFTNPELPLV